MNTSKLTIVAITALAITSAPHVKAEEEGDLSNWYLTGSVGVANPVDVESKKKHYTYNGNSVDTKFVLEHENAVDYSIGVGYFLSPKTRLEFSYSNTGYDLDKAGLDGTLNSTQGEVRVPASHDASVDSFILSINRDFPYSSGWKPFVGFGIGFSSISVDDTTASLTSLGNVLGADLGTETILTGSDNTVFTFQVRGGIAKDISRNADVFAEVSFTGTEGFSAGSGANKIDWEGVKSVAVKGGARYRF